MRKERAMENRELRIKNGKRCCKIRNKLKLNRKRITSAKIFSRTVKV